MKTKFRQIILRAHCGKTRNLLSLKNVSSNQLFSDFFSKFVVFTKFLPKKRESKFLLFPHCGCGEQIFREIDVIC